jgi:dipeptidyl-peptidase 4
MVIDAWMPRLLWQHLADRGFFVFQLDNRGSAGRGPAFEHLVYERLGERELEDQVAGATWLASMPEVDPTRIGLYGHSYGGFLTGLAMLKAPGRFAAGVAYAPVTDWRLYDSAYTERFMSTPKANAKGYEAADLSRFAGSLAGPLFLVHANMDENVHYANTAKLVDALATAGKEFDLLVLPGERHGVRNPAIRAYVNERITSWLVSHL